VAQLRLHKIAKPGVDEARIPLTISTHGVGQEGENDF
jgi:hypothetical protein